VRILRKNLKKYSKTAYEVDGKQLWAKPEVLKKLYSKRTKIPKVKRGYTKFTERKFRQYSFPLNRKKLNDVTDIPHLMKIIRKKYALVSKKHLTFPAQRIIMHFGTTEKTTFTKRHFKTKRERTRENVAKISTHNYSRSKKDTEAMFDKIQEDIENIFLKQFGYQSLDWQDSIVTALKFVVTFASY